MGIKLSIKFRIGFIFKDIFYCRLILYCTLIHFDKMNILLEQIKYQQQEINNPNQKATPQSSQQIKPDHYLLFCFGYFPMSLILSPSQIQPAPYREYPYRFVIVMLYSSASIINGMCWVTVTPISVQIQYAYSTSALVVAFIPMSYMLFYIFVNFPSNWLIDVKGVKKGIVVGAAMTMLGTAIRCLVRVGFGFVVIGQILCSIGQPFLTNAPMKIASRWFMPQNRSFAMALLTVVNIIGTAVGFLIPPFFVTQKDDHEQVRDHFFILLLVQSIIASISTILIILFFKQHPPSPPSPSSQTPSSPFFPSLVSMIRSPKFMLLALSFGTVNGTFNIYGSLMDDILDPYGFSSDTVSVYGAVLMGVGIVSAGVMGIYVEKTLGYRKVFIFCGLVGLVTIVGFPLMMKYWINAEKYYWAYMAMVALQGLVFIPLQPLTVDYGSDTMFPIGEATITGFVLTVGQIFGILFVEVAQLGFGLGEQNNSKQQQQNAAFKSVLFCNSFLALGCLILMFQKGQLKRAKLDYHLQSEQESLIKADGSLVSGNSTFVQKSHETSLQ